VQILQVACASGHVLAFLMLQLHPKLQAGSALTLLGVPAAISLCRFAALNYGSPRLIKPLKVYAIKWHSAMGAALFLALVTAGVSVHGAESLA
jgi:hypothetical protein